MPRVKNKPELEVWAELREFPRYEISSHGNIFNSMTNREMRVSENNYGHLKISLFDVDGYRRTKSVGTLVAETFVEKPNILCDSVIFLNGDHHDCRADNLAWRPRWFAWQYTKQLQNETPHYYRNLKVINVLDEIEYANILEAATTEGLLFEHIWHSTYTGNPVYPNGSVWAVAERV